MGNHSGVSRYSRRGVWKITAALCPAAQPVVSRDDIVDVIGVRCRQIFKQGDTMKRRTLLKGAAATTALGAIGMRRPQKSAAARRVRLIQQELPMYEIESFFVSDTFVVDNGQNFRGIPRDISNDGTICGEIVSNGLLTPVTWDASMTMRVLDMGKYIGNSASVLFVNDGGRAAGSLSRVGTFRTEDQAIASANASTAPDPFLVWDDGLLNAELLASMPAEYFFNSLAESGTLAGGAGELPARWVDDLYEAVTMPAGFQTGGARSQAPSGDMAGTLYMTEEPLVGGIPFIWRTTGEVELQQPPGKDDPQWAGRLQVFGFQDDGSFVAVVRGLNDLYGRAIRYAADGTQTPMADLNGEGMFVRDANASGTMVGQSMLNGYSIPTLWTNDQPIAIADLIVPGPDLLLLEVNGLNDSGVLVGEAQDSAGMAHHVILRPV